MIYVIAERLVRRLRTTQYDIIIRKGLRHPWSGILAIMHSQHHVASWL